MIQVFESESAGHRDCIPAAQWIIGCCGSVRAELRADGPCHHDLLRQYDMIKC